MEVRDTELFAGNQCKFRSFEAPRKFQVCQETESLQRGQEEDRLHGKEI